MNQACKNAAAFSLVGAVDISVLDGLYSKQLGTHMEKAHKLHSRLGHPSNRLLMKNLQARGADSKFGDRKSNLRGRKKNIGGRKTISGSEK